MFAKFNQRQFAYIVTDGYFEQLRTIRKNYCIAYSS